MWSDASALCVLLPTRGLTAGELCCHSTHLRRSASAVRRRGDAAQAVRLCGVVATAHPPSSCCLFSTQPTHAAARSGPVVPQYLSMAHRGEGGHVGLVRDHDDGDAALAVQAREILDVEQDLAANLDPLGRGVRIQTERNGTDGLDVARDVFARLAVTARSGAGTMATIAARYPTRSVRERDVGDVDPEAVHLLDLHAIRRDRSL